MRSTRRHITTKTINLPPLDRRVIEFNVGRKLHRKQLRTRAHLLVVYQRRHHFKVDICLFVYMLLPRNEFIGARQSEARSISINTHHIKKRLARALTSSSSRTGELLLNSIYIERVGIAVSRSPSHAPEYGGLVCGVCGCYGGAFGASCGNHGDHTWSANHQVCNANKAIHTMMTRGF